MTRRNKLRTSHSSSVFSESVSLKKHNTSKVKWKGILAATIVVFAFLLVIALILIVALI